MFAALYPTKPSWGRAASLARSLVSAKIEKCCEFRAITGLPAEKATLACSDTIEAAHIKPHHLGGSDKADNGLWLCKEHHKKTEAKLKGNRGDVCYFS